MPGNTFMSWFSYIVCILVRQIKAASPHDHGGLLFSDPPSFPVITTTTTIPDPHLIYRPNRAPKDYPGYQRFFSRVVRIFGVPKVRKNVFFWIRTPFSLRVWVWASFSFRIWIRAYSSLKVWISVLLSPDLDERPPLSSPKVWIWLDSS